MDVLATNSWLRQGSSILFDQTEIQKLLKMDCMISLREFLAWRDKELPEEPPIPGDCSAILVCGLETVMDTLPPPEAQEFLQREVRPVIKQLQNIWPQTGVVFGFSQGARSFQELNGFHEEVLFQRGGNQQVRISEGLWDGTEVLNVSRLEDASGRKLGYHVKRIS